MNYNDPAEDGILAGKAEARINKLEDDITLLERDIERLQRKLKSKQELLANSHETVDAKIGRALAKLLNMRTPYTSWVQVFTSREYKNIRNPRKQREYLDLQVFFTRYPDFDVEDELALAREFDI